MGTFVFFTDEGFTIAPNGQDINNLQVLGIEQGRSKQEAIEALLSNNKWINEMGFNEKTIKCFHVSNPDIVG